MGAVPAYPCGCMVSLYLASKQADSYLLLSKDI